VADAPDVPQPGRAGTWLTEAFNDWPEGSRAAALAAQQAGVAMPAAVPAADPAPAAADGG
jgi:hypothetical protein